MKYPDHVRYEALYQRYFRRGPDALLDLLWTPNVYNLAGQTLLDLCGGGGRLSREAKRRGAAVTYLDAEPAMTPEDLVLGGEIAVEFGTVADYLSEVRFRGRRFDFIACQQAINYWLIPGLAEVLADCLSLGGTFIFNTFNTKPSRQPTVKTYEMTDAIGDPQSFVEVSYLDDNGFVHHFQGRTGLAPHTTKFRWISPEQFREWLEPAFGVIDEQRDGPTSIWRCTR